MIYFLDGNQEVIKIARSGAVISAIQTQELPEDNSLLRDYLSVRLKNDERLFDAQYMAVKSYGGNRNAFDLYRIASEMVPDNATEFVGVQVAPYELEGVVIEDLRPQNRPLNQAMNQVLEGSDWRLGYVADNLPNVTTNFYYMSVKDALKQIQGLLNVEMLFKVEISGNKITDKWVEVYHQLGNRTMKRFNYGTNALSVVRESSHDELYTALIGRGKGEEVGETESGNTAYGRKINFADVEWKKSTGNPVDKPKGQKYIELPEATAEFGVKMLDGRKVPRIGIVEFSDTDDPEKLIQETYQELLIRARPKVLFKASVINTGDMLIGDTVTIHRHDLDFHYQARVRKVVRDRKNNNKTQVEIGDVVHTPSTKRQGQINSALNNVASDLENVRGELTEARQSADGKNTNFYGNVEPDRKKVGDTWFRDHPNLTGESQILVWNGEAWELIMDTSETTKNADAIEEQKKNIEEAKQTADEAVNQIDTAVANAGFSSLTDLTASLDGRTTALTANVDSITSIVTDHQDRISTVEQTAEGLQTTVAGKADQSQVTQLDNLYNIAVGRLDKLGNPNLIVLSDLENGTFNASDGSPTITSRSNRLRTMNFIEREVNEDFVFSLQGTTFGIQINIYQYDADKNYISNVGFKDFENNEMSYIPNPDTRYFKLLIRFKNGQDINASHITQAKLKLESGSQVTDYDTSYTQQAQISVLSDNINLRVQKGELLSQINIEAGRTLIESDKILLNASNTVITGTAWMDGAVIANASIDGAKIQDATIGSAKIASLDAGKITFGTLEGIRAEIEEGVIGGWTLGKSGGRSALYGLINGKYTTLKAHGDVALAVSSLDPFSTPGAELQVWHDGTLRFGRTDTMIYKGSYNSLMLESSEHVIARAEKDIRLEPLGNVRVHSHLRPEITNAWSLGSGSLRWARINLVQQPDVSSDMRDKELIQDIPEGLIDNLKEIKPKMYRQGDKWHFGYIAQDVERAIYKYVTGMKKWGDLDAMNEYARKFAMLHKDESKLSLLYGEIAVVKEAEMQRRIDKLEEIVNAN